MWITCHQTLLPVLNSSRNYWMCFLSYYLLPPSFCPLLAFSSTHNPCLSLQNSKSCKLFTHSLRDFRLNTHWADKRTALPIGNQSQETSLSFITSLPTYLLSPSLGRDLLHRATVWTEKRLSLLIAWFVNCHSQTPPACNRCVAKISQSIWHLYGSKQVNL